MEIALEFLQSLGLVCEGAENGRRAVEMFNASAPGHYEMILMDVRMPVMNGYEATRRFAGWRVKMRGRYQLWQ